MGNESAILNAPEPVLSTMEEDGSRRWINPRLAKGRFWHRRRFVAYGLLALFTLIPFLRIGGRPVLLLDVMHRRFTILGTTFLPTDMGYLALFALSWLVSIFFVTALLGRVWCGWICPQTVYMEYVFRPIERLIYGRAGRGGKSPTPVAAWRQVLKFVTYAAICVHLANTFLAYFVPSEVLSTWIAGSPAAHPAGFTIVAVVAAAMMFNFGWFREQTCIIACPYGRLQSVLLDKQSLIISYDQARGEPRGRKTRMKEEAGRSVPLSSSILQPSALPAQGDCIDCEMCVQVCPTGIDIRRGLQVECLACAQCIDACDSVMDKVHRPRGLIRYASRASMAGEKVRILRPRVIIYSAIAAGLVTLLTVLLASRSAADVTLLRSVGRPFVVLGDGRVENTFKIKIANRTDRPQTYRVSAVDAADLEVDMTGADVLTVQPGQAETEPGRLISPANKFLIGHRDVTIRVTPTGDGGGPPIDRPFRLLGPANAPK